MSGEDRYADLVTVTRADQVDDAMIEDVLSCLDFFWDQKGLGTEEFIDKLSDTYGLGSTPPWELDSYDSPAARKIMRIARSARREALL
jgi:hypothetical protein